MITSSLSAALTHESLSARAAHRLLSLFGLAALALLYLCAQGCALATEQQQPAERVAPVALAEPHCDVIQSEMNNCHNGHCQILLSCNCDPQWQPSIREDFDPTASCAAQAEPGVYVCEW